MKFPFRICSRSRWEKMKGIEDLSKISIWLKEMQEAEEAEHPMLQDRVFSSLDTNKSFSILDVGANQGKWATAISKRFQNATVHAIEADPKTYGSLKKNVEKIDAIKPVNIALDSTTGIVSFNSHENSLLSSIADLSDVGGRIEQFQVLAETLDEFVSKRQINDLKLIKIDTEGHDLNVLKGGGETLANPSLDFLVLEFGIDESDQRHVNLNLLISFLEKAGFYLRTLGGWGLHNRESIYGNAIFVRKLH